MNARSLKNKLDDFHAEIIDSDIPPLVVGVTETWLDDTFPNALFDCKDVYDDFRRDRNGKGGGVALFTHKKLKCKILHSEKFGIYSSFCEIYAG